MVAAVSRWLSLSLLPCGGIVVVIRADDRVIDASGGDGIVVAVVATSTMQAVGSSLTQVVVVVTLTTLEGRVSSS